MEFQKISSDYYQIRKTKQYIYVEFHKLSIDCYQIKSQRRTQKTKDIDMEFQKLLLVFKSDKKTKKTQGESCQIAIRFEQKRRAQKFKKYHEWEKHRCKSGHKKLKKDNETKRNTKKNIGSQKNTILSYKKNKKNTKFKTQHPL